MSSHCKILCFLLVLFSFAAIFINAQLAPDVSTEVTCTTDQQCNFLYGKYTHCQDGKCACWDPSTKNATKCVYQNKSQKVTVLGFPCEVDANCKPEKSVCHTESKQCICPDDFKIESADRRHCLRPISSANDTCEDTMQCVIVLENSICQEGKCRCANLYNSHNNACFIKSKLNDRCLNDGNCKHIENSECHDGTCRCVEGYLSNLEGTACLPIRNNINEPCLEHSQCHFNLGEGAFCLDGSCSCTIGYITNKNSTYCDLLPFVGMECTSDDHCNLSQMRENDETYKMICTSGKCLCAEDHLEKDGFCFTNSSSKTAAIASYTILLGFFLTRYKFWL